MKTYVTFGQIHRHVVNEITFDRNCIAAIDHDDDVDGRDLAFQIFGSRFAFCYYSEDEFRRNVNLGYFPRGIVHLQYKRADMEVKQLRQRVRELETLSVPVEYASVICHLRASLTDPVEASRQAHLDCAYSALKKADQISHSQPKEQS